jgi:hypothetical protein
VPTLAERIAADVSKIMQDIYGMSTIQPYHENYDCIQSLYHVISYYIMLYHAISCYIYHKHP